MKMDVWDWLVGALIIMAVFAVLMLASECAAAGGPGYSEFTLYSGVTTSPEHTVTTDAKSFGQVLQNFSCEVSSSGSGTASVIFMGGLSYLLTSMMTSTTDCASLPCVVVITAKPTSSIKANLRTYTDVTSTYKIQCSGAR